VCCAPDLCKKALGSTASCIASATTCDGRVEANLCATGKKCCAPPIDYPPAGQIFSRNGKISGWACDKVCSAVFCDIQLVALSSTRVNNKRQ
jgi:hypothetical protein